jgi:hypothetical protein
MQFNWIWISTKFEINFQLNLLSQFCVCVWVCVCVCQCVYVCVCIHVSVCLCEYVSDLYVCVTVYVYMCVSVYVCLCVCMCICMWVCVYVCVCLCELYQQKPSQMSYLLKLYLHNGNPTHWLVPVTKEKKFFFCIFVKFGKHFERWNHKTV